MRGPLTYLGAIVSLADSVSRPQNWNLTANWKLRCGSALKYAVELMRPALGRSLPGDPISVSGLPRFTLLNRFTASIRNSRSRVEPIPKRLKIDASVRRYPGPLSELRTLLPNVPTAGVEYGLLGARIGVGSKY